MEDARDSPALDEGSFTRPSKALDRDRQCSSLKVSNVLNLIRREWSFMTESECIPVQVALQLMDSSSLGRAHQDGHFLDAYKDLQQALKGIVNEHHQGFSNSIGLFHKIQASLLASQQRLRILRDSLVIAKANLSTTKPEFKRLGASSRDYSDMLHTLGQVERLQSVPETLEAKISEKKFLGAIDVLNDALVITKTPEIGNISALADTKAYVASQETSLVDILVEELHSHLYLRSPYSHERWRSSVFGIPAGHSSGTEDPAVAALSTTRLVNVFLENLDLSSPMVDDMARHPEVDNFSYIQLLLESFNKLGRLDVAVESIEQRLPTELFRLVDRTNTEIEQQHRNLVRPSPGKDKGAPTFESQDVEVRETIISDLLTTLYSKFEAIAESHRVLHDIIEGILRREEVSNASLTGSFNELWKLYQNEMRTILHDYLASEVHNAFRLGQIQPGGGSVFRRGPRDKSKMLFKFSSIDPASTDLAVAESELNNILRVSVPGLVSEFRRPAGTAGGDGNAHVDVSATGHKLLVEPSVFNMGFLLRPSLSFIRRLAEIVPPGLDIASNSLTSFLDEFLVNVFQPQVDETVTEYSAQIFIELDSFQMDPEWATVAKRPVFKGTTAFFSLIASFCRMLDTVPHDETFTQPIIAQLVTYYDKCRGFYKSLVTRAQSQAESGIRLKAAASLSENDDLREVTSRLWAGSGDTERQLLERETGLLINLTHETPLEAASVISDRKAIMSLCILYTSMKWLSGKLSRLRRAVHEQVDDAHGSIKGGLSGRWASYEQNQTVTETSPVYLPLTDELVSTFDAVVASYLELAASVLFTLHMEIRCEVILQIIESLRGNYVLEQASNEPDQAVLNVNADLVGFDEDLITYLRPQEHRFVTTGLTLLVDHLLVANAPRIKAMNVYGCERMQLNMLVLRQNLKNIEPEMMDLTRSAQYFGLFIAGADAIVARAKEDAGSGSSGHDAQPGERRVRFRHEELKFLMELCYSEALSSDRREAALQANRALNDHLLRLSEHTWQSSQQEQPSQQEQQQEQQQQQQEHVEVVGTASKKEQSDKGDEELRSRREREHEPEGNGNGNGNGTAEGRN